MANRDLFQTLRRAELDYSGVELARPDVLNFAKAPAYDFRPEHKLAQYAVTGCLNGTYYASASKELETVLEICQDVDPTVIAKTAVYARTKGRMKDMPALLLAVLSSKSPELFKRIFPLVIDDLKMLRNFVQIMRSGQTGRRSLGSLPKRMVESWLDSKSEAAIFRQSVGANPSPKDLVKMIHPKPKTEERAAFYAYLLEKPHEFAKLPTLVRAYEDFKEGRTRKVPELPFNKLDSLNLSKEDWTEVARNASWQTTRMNLNTFARKGVFETPEMASLVAERLSDPEAIAKAKVFPYQLLIAYKMVNENVPFIVKEALQDAMEQATRNVPKIEGKVVICPDVSGSMKTPITGDRKVPSKVSCVDVAALVSASILRVNPDAEILPFEYDTVDIRLNPRDSIMSNAEKLGEIGGGGTNCSAPFKLMNRRGTKANLVVMVSDNQSWVDAEWGSSTTLVQEWRVFKERNPDAKLACIDIQPYGNTQAPDRRDVLNIGGFSDEIFSLLADYSKGEFGEKHWLKHIEEVEI